MSINDKSDLPKERQIERKKIYMSEHTQIVMTITDLII